MPKTKTTHVKNSLIVKPIGVLQDKFAWHMTNSRGEFIAKSKSFSTRAGAKKSAMSVAKNTFKVISVTKAKKS